MTITFYVTQHWIAWNQFLFKCCGHCKVHCLLKIHKNRSVMCCFFFFKEAARTNWEFYYLTVVVKFQNDVAKMQTTHIRCVQSWVSLLAEITRCWTTMTAILIPFWIQLIDIYSQLPNFIKRNIDSFSFQTIFAKAIYAFLNQLFV